MNKVQYFHESNGIAQTFGLTEDREKELDLKMEQTFQGLQEKSKSDGSPLSTSMVVEAHTSAAETEAELAYCAFIAGTFVEHVSQRQQKRRSLAETLGIGASPLDDTTPTEG